MANRFRGQGGASPRLEAVRRILGRIVRGQGRGPARMRRPRPHRVARPGGGGPRRHLPLALLGLVLLLLAGTACLRLGQAILALDIFDINVIRVEGLQRVSREEVLKASGLRFGANSMEVDREAVARRIVEGLPQVRSAWLRRERLHDLVITVEEYQPVALAALPRDGGRVFYYLDAEGCAYAPVGPRGEMDFPVLTGALEPPGRDDCHIGPRQAVAEALDFIALARNPVLPVQSISELVVDGEGLTLFLVEHSFAVSLGRHRMDLKYRRLARVLDDLYRRRDVDEVRRIDMEYTENRVLVARNEP